MQSDQIKESISHNDLKNLINPVISIDQYKSKMGEDKNMVVLAIKIKDKDPANDLSQFIETGFKKQVLDVDVSPGPDDKGEYTVFVEVSRDDKLYEIISSIVGDMENLDEDITNKWKFVSYENKEEQLFNEESFKNSIISSIQDYEIKHNPDAAAVSERLKFLNSY